MSRARVLLTGFAPFAGEPVNPSWELVRELAQDADHVPGLRCACERLPVAHAELRPALDAALARHAPAAVIAVGQASGRPEICLEGVAVNRLAYGDLVDNAGLSGVDQPLHPGGPERLEASLPAARLSDVLARSGHPVRLSQDAGTFLCNALLYELLLTRPELPALFVHVPLLPEQALRRDRGEPCLSHELSRAALRSLLQMLPDQLRGPAPGVA